MTLAAPVRMRRPISSTTPAAHADNAAMIRVREHPRADDPSRGIRRAAMLRPDRLDCCVFPKNPEWRQHSKTPWCM